MREITVTGNGVLLKGSRMLLPKALQSDAIELAHRGAHPGRSGLARRLRYHFDDMSQFKLGPSAISPCVALALGELNFTYQYRVSGGATKGWPVKLRRQIPIEFSLPTRSLG